MQRVSLNRALNKEIKYYGLSYFGLIGGGLAGCFVWLWLGMTIGIMGAVVGYAISSMWAKGWQIGVIQRFIYWNFLKCFWNEQLGKETSLVTNFDWYSPSNARRR